MPRALIPQILFFPESITSDVFIMVDTLREGLSRSEEWRTGLPRFQRKALFFGRSRHEDHTSFGQSHEEREDSDARPDEHY